jgi:methyl-accepting chemotaxis protein
VPRARRVWQTKDKIMNFINDMKITGKVAALLVMLGMVTVCLSIMSYRTIVALDTDYSALTNSNLPATTNITRANRMTVEMVYAGYRVLTYDGGSAEAREAAKRVGDAHDAGAKLFDEAARQDPSIAGKVREFRKSFEEINAAVERGVKAGLVNQNDEAKRELVEADRQMQAFTATLAPLNDARIAASDARSAELTSVAQSTSFWMLAMSIGGVLAAVGIAIALARNTIARPLDRLQATMRKLATGDATAEVTGTERGDEVGSMAKALLVFRDALIDQQHATTAKASAEAEQRYVVDTVSEKLLNVSGGDLSADITVQFPPAYTQLRTNFNAALGNLRELIGSVIESSHSLRTGSGEIAQASEDLARRTESNAASLEETSAALTQIDGRIKATAEAARRTVTRADEAISTVSGGRVVADEAVQAMSRVRASAKGIDEVIEGVDKIAFQTRVLAMNAAVEAGRAGDAGRGFAVVADLVSALAMRAEEEAKRARDQLTVTQTDIVTAVEAVQRVDGALAGISEGVGEVHQLLGGMAADNQAQASAISQISVAVSSMDQATQQNAAMVEETSAAARNLNGESEALAEKAGEFKIGAETRQSRIVVRSGAKTPGHVANDRSAPVAAKVNGYANGSMAMAAADGDWASF